MSSNGVAVPSVAELLDIHTKSLLTVPSIRKVVDRVDAALRDSLAQGLQTADVSIAEEVGGFNVYGVLKATRDGFCEFMGRGPDGSEFHGAALNKLLRDVALKRVDGSLYDAFYRFDLSMLRNAAPALLADTVAVAEQVEVNNSAALMPARRNRP
jgi:hypothetical protein